MGEQGYQETGMPGSRSEEEKEAKEPGGRDMRNTGDKGPRNQYEGIKTAESED